MGINVFKRSSSSCWDPSAHFKKTPPNPDPKNFKILKDVSYGQYLVVRIKYPDCTNFEGNKILVFFGVSRSDLYSRDIIDPHFFDDKTRQKSPIARFEPTVQGWKMAELFAATMHDLEKENHE